MAASFSWRVGTCGFIAALVPAGLFSIGLGDRGNRPMLVPFVPATTSYLTIISPFMTIQWPGNVQR
jgi:hypothetical protein